MRCARWASASSTWSTRIRHRSPGSQPRQRGVDRRRTRRGSRRSAWCGWRPGRPCAQQRHHLAVGAAALGLRPGRGARRRRRRRGFGLLADVLVAPVAGAADDDRAALGRHGVDRAAPAPASRPGCGRSRRSRSRRGSRNTLKRPGALCASLTKLARPRADRVPVACPRPRPRPPRPSRSRPGSRCVPLRVIGTSASGDALLASRAFGGDDARRRRRRPRACPARGAWPSPDAAGRRRRR